MEHIFLLYLIVGGYLSAVVFFENTVAAFFAQELGLVLSLINVLLQKILLNYSAY